MQYGLKASQRLCRLFEIFKSAKTMLIITQDYPDPDAIASAAAIRYLANTLSCINCSLGHGGAVGRSENRAMVKYLGFNFHHLNNIDHDRFDIIAMVDTQPGTGNNPLPDGVMPDIVIDHHPVRAATRKCQFTDIRSRYGATSTILYEYIKMAGLSIDTPLATAMVYGIRTDTQDLGRQTTRADIEAYLALYPEANKRMLSRIMRAPVPQSYYQLFYNSLKNAVNYNNGIISNIGEMNNPDMIAEMADLLHRCEGCDWILVYGKHLNRILLSMRAADPNAEAGDVIRKIIGSYGTGGGHSTFAGGQIPLGKKGDKAIAEIGEKIEARFRRFLKAQPEDGNHLVAPDNE